MGYSLTAYSSPSQEGKVDFGSNEVFFGVTKESKLASPAQLLVSAFAACCLKNVERFSEFMKFEYDKSEIQVTALRQDKPPMISKIDYMLIVYTNDADINVDLLHRNLQKFGTIYNTLNQVCDINGEIVLKNHAH